MKWIALGLMAMVAWPVAAQEPAAERGPGQRFTLRLGAPEKQKSTWLGLAASPAPEALREQAKLPRGVGLAVDHVDPKGPAGQAGVQARDLLHKLDDQLLVNSEQLTALVRSMKPGDGVTLSIYRDGQARKIDVRLGETETWEGPAPAPGAMGPMPADVLVWRGAAHVQGGDGGVPMRVIIQAAASRQTTTWSDPQHSITLEREDGVTKRATVRELATGKEIFNGPIETPEQRKALPQEVREKIEKAEAAGAVQPQIMWLGGGAGAGGPSSVRVWQDDQHVLVLRVAQAPVYLLALSKKDGRTLFDGPTATEEQRQSIPAEVADKFQAIAKNPEMAKELGGK